MKRSLESLLEAPIRLLFCVFGEAACHRLRCLFCKVCRRHILQCAVRSLSIVVIPPGIELLLGIRQGQEPVLVEAFGPQAPVEGLNQTIVGRLAETEVLQAGW